MYSIQLIPEEHSPQHVGTVVVFFRHTTTTLVSQSCSNGDHTPHYSKILEQLSQEELECDNSRRELKLCIASLEVGIPFF